MDPQTEFAYNGTAHLLLGAFTADGAGLIALGEQAVVDLSLSGGTKGFVRTPSGHRSARGAVDYGRVPSLQVQADIVSKELVGTLLSAAEVTPEGNVKLHTAARAVTPVSGVVIPSYNVAADGSVIDLSDVYWLPFLTDDDEVKQTWNNSRGDNANTPFNVALRGLVEDTYGATPLPAGMHTYYHGNPADEGLTWKLPVPYQAAGV